MKTLRILALLLLFFSSCAKPPPPEEPLDRLYRGIAEMPRDLDLSRLAGRTILIDPGHGGRFSGTVGLDGLAEKDVNLGVALYLWGLLRDAGADAHLTRASDRDLLAESEEPNLEKDLAARVAIADSLEPDLFLSIHHNADADTNRERNRVETYHRAGDEGPSLDAARAIHAHLVRNLGIPEGDVLPGNFYVLRESRFPAVLGEPSYLSHPPVEKKLLLAEKRRLEAEAYFFGIAEYFARGVPSAVIEEPRETVRGPSGLRFAGTVVDDEGGSGIDPTTVRVSLDGKPLRARFDPSTGRVLAALPPLLPPGEHRAGLRARNLGGNESLEAERIFHVRFPPARLLAEGLALPGNGGLVIELRVEDERGLAVADGTDLEATIGPSGNDSFRVETLNGRVLLATRAGSPPGRIQARGEDFRIETFVDPARFERPEAAILLTDENGRPLEDAELRVNGEWIGRARFGGWMPLPSPLAAGDRIFVETAGSAAAADGASLAMPIDTLRVPAFPPPPLRGKRVLLDPDGGRADDPFPSAARSLLLAIYLEEMLRDAGAEAFLTRAGDAVPSLDRRLGAAREVRPDFWITLSFGDSIGVRHFPGSREGTPAASAIARALEERLGADLPVSAGTDRVLRETPCPALRLRLPMEKDEGRRTRGRIRGAAHAVLDALAERFDETPADRAALVLRISLPGALVRIDDSCTYQAIGGDSLVIRGLSPGPRRVRVETPEGFEEFIVELAPGERRVLP